MSGKKTIDATIDDWRKYLSLFRSYPDLFIDFILPKESIFQLFFFQRVILRIMLRYRRTYFTLTRGASKSFLQILAKIIECILYPNIKIALTAPQKNMATGIAQQTINAIWEFIPALRAEVRSFHFGDNNTKLIFWNGAVFDIVINNPSSRGLRKHGVAVEEIVHEGFDEDSFNEVIIPTMAHSRTPACGGKDPYELRSKISIATTAGTKQSFAYELLMEYLRDMVQGKSAFILGSSYEMPVAFDLLDLGDINARKESPTFNPVAFLREYGSVWSGSSDKSLVDLETFREARILKVAEHKAVKDKNSEYVLAYDVARSTGGAQSALVVIKITPKEDGTFSKHVVNIFSLQGTHFKEQAKFVKQKVVDFRARVLVIDANGLGKLVPLIAVTLYRKFSEPTKVGCVDDYDLCYR